MGCIPTKEKNNEAYERSLQLDKKIKKEKNDQWRDVKLLLLGTGESGKSTIVKQMRIINDNGYDETERLKFRTTVFHNTIQSLILIIRAMPKLGINFDDPYRMTDAQTLLHLSGCAERNTPLNMELLDSMKKLWQDSGVQSCFQRSREYQLPDSAEYYLNNLDRIGDQNYIPSEQDVLRTRVTTVGIHETVVSFKEIRLRIIDVGGQRTERRKWIHCFDNVNAIIFIVALSEYDLTLFEDPSVNRMMESLKLFESMCNNPIFKEVCMILFLNKTDLFAQKILKSPLNICFTEYLGENTYESCVRYIRLKFENANKFPETKMIFTHETCATDSNNVKKVFDDINSIMMKKLLEAQGLM